MADFQSLRFNGIPIFNKLYFGDTTVELSGGTSTFTVATGGATRLTIDSTGLVSFNGSIFVGSHLAMGAVGSTIYWPSGTTIGFSANGQLNVTNYALSAGIGLDVTTDALLKVRTRAQTGYATVDALAYQVSGTPGVSGTFANVTVVNGIVTAGT